VNQDVAEMRTTAVMAARETAAMHISAHSCDQATQ
jgi:hypothetical protein